MIVPFIWMFLTSFKSLAESTSVNPFIIFPTVWRTDAYEYVIATYNFVILYKNTLLLILIRIICACVTATMAGYGLSRLKFPGKNVVMGLVLFQMMVPSQIFVISQYKMIIGLGMLNTMFALVFPGIVSAFGTFLLRQAYMSLPTSLEEAARLDGCNPGQTFLFIMAPLTKSALVALGIFTALFAYKELMWPMIVNTANDKITLTVALAKMQGNNGTDYPELMAAALISCVPMIIIYLIFQKQFIAGISTSGSKL